MRITLQINGLPVTVEADDPQTAINVALTLTKAMTSDDFEITDAVSPHQLGFPVPEGSDDRTTRRP